MKGCHRALPAMLLCCLLLEPLWAGEGIAERSAMGEIASPVSENADHSEDLSEQISGELLKNGSRGSRVTALQRKLEELGYLPGDIDGIFGAATRDAVRAFQRRNGLASDGIAGPETLSRLYSAEAIPAAAATDVLAGAWPMLVNRDKMLDPDFTPKDLVLISEICSEDLIHVKYSGMQGVREAVEALAAMLRAAHAEGLTKWQVSAGYRSLADQESMLNRKIRSYMDKNPSWKRSRARSAALRTVAEPGCSEHHLGLAFDVNVPGTSSFSGTKQCTWLHANCWDFGFIIRYQKGKESITGFTAEPWHIRYVGVEHSLAIRDQEVCLEEYLALAAQEDQSLTEYVDLDENPS